MRGGSSLHKESRIMLLCRLVRSARWLPTLVAALVSGPSYALATVVALITGVRGVCFFLALLDAPEIVKLTGSTAEENPVWLAAAQGVGYTNLLFGGSLLQDLVQVMLHFPKLGGWEQVEPDERPAQTLPFTLFS